MTPLKWFLELKNRILLSRFNCALSNLRQQVIQLTSKLLIEGPNYYALEKITTQKRLLLVLSRLWVKNDTFSAYYIKNIPFVTRKSKKIDYYK